jgi:hypothetical protein
MSSKVSLVNKKTGSSPLLGSESLAFLHRDCAEEFLPAPGSSPSLLSTSSPAFHYLPRLISSPATPSSQHAPLISTSPLSPKAAVLLDLFPVDAPMLPPKAASLLDMTCPRATASTPRTIHAIPAVTTTVASPTASIIGVPATLRSPALSIAPKAIDRLGVHVPLGPPSPTWSEYSTSSLQFYGSTPAAAGGLGLKLGYRASHGVHTRASSCALPADELGRLERARARGHKPRSSVSSTATKSSTHSIRRKPVPAWDDAPPSPSADSIRFSAATPPPTSASSSCRPSADGPKYHGKSASTGARVTFAELPLPPRPAARRTRSVEALNGRPTTPAVGYSDPRLVVSDPPARKLVKSPSMPMLTTGLGILTAAPPQINVIEPSPVKRPTSVGNFNGAISDAHGMLVIPDWSPSTPGGIEQTQPTAAPDVDQAPPSPTDSGIHVALHPMVRTQRSPPHSRAPSPAPSHASAHSTSALSFRASTPTPTPASGDASSSLPRRRRARPVDIRTALGPTTRQLNMSPTGSTFTFGEPPTRMGSFESTRSDRSLGVPADAKASTGGRLSLRRSLSSSKSAPSLRSRRRENAGGPDHGKMDFVCRGERMAAATRAQDRVHDGDLPGAPSSRPLERSVAVVDGPSTRVDFSPALRRPAGSDDARLLHLGLFLCAHVHVTCMIC